MEEKRVIKIDETQSSQRLDAFLSKLEDLEISRSYIQDLIKSEKIFINGKKTKASYKLKTGDGLEVNIPEPKELEIEAENIPLEIVFEDDHMMIINKPINMVTHPGSGIYSGTLVNAIMHHVKVNQSQLSSINGVLRPGIVHRLDKDTSGLISVAKSDAAHKSLQEQIQSRNLKRHYLCLVHENIKNDKGTIDKPIGRNPKDRQKMAIIENQEKARSARTHYRVLKRFEFKGKLFCLVECQLDTGRTHQIRVHMSHIKHPIVGDFTYNAPKKNPFNASRPLLHSYKMSLNHPVTNDEMNFEIDLPEDFQAIMKFLDT